MYKSHSANNINDNQESLRYSLNIYSKYEYGNYNVKINVGLQFLLEMLMIILGQRLNSRNFNSWANQAWCEILIHSGFFIYYLGGHSLIASIYICMPDTLHNSGKTVETQTNNRGLTPKEFTAPWLNENKNVPKHKVWGVGGRKVEWTSGGQPWGLWWRGAVLGFQSEHWVTSSWHHHHQLA